LDIKIKKGIAFLEKGDKVRVSCVFRGRELLHKEIGERIFERICKELAEVGTLESPAKLLGRTLSVVVAPSQVSQKK
jgi:translation initiation factor IF-3